MVLKFCCCMSHIAATRAEGGLVVVRVNSNYPNINKHNNKISRTEPTIITSITTSKSQIILTRFQPNLSGINNNNNNTPTNNNNNNNISVINSTGLEPIFSGKK